MPASSSYVAVARENQRLRVAVVLLGSAVAALSITLGVVASSAGNSAEGHRSTTRTSTSLGNRSKGRHAGGGTAHTAAPAHPKVLVGVTTSGFVEDLAPSTGAPVRTLATGAAGDEVSVTPDGQNVYFEAAIGCMHQIERVSLAGGAPAVVATGSFPAISPDGSQLAYVREPLSNEAACQGQSFAPSQYALVVRNLSNSSETTYPVAPQVASTGLAYPIDHVSWSQNGQEIAVSIEAPQDNEGWQLVVLHPATDEFYYSGSGVPLIGANAATAYYREGVFMPNGDLFVNRVCCAGEPVDITSSLLVEVNPLTGGTLHQVAIGITSNDHTSLDVDSSGHWLLYVSGGAIFVSENGARPTTLTSGFESAAW